MADPAHHWDRRTVWAIGGAHKNSRFDTLVGLGGPMFEQLEERVIVDHMWSQLLSHRVMP
jgi:hypothetical protein